MTDGAGVRGWRKAVMIIHEGVIKAWPAWGEEDRRFLALALAGEVGEALNVIKKRWRGDDDPTYEGKIAEELADCRIYLELLALAHGMDLDAACTEIVRMKLVKRWPQFKEAALAALAPGDAVERARESGIMEAVRAAQQRVYEASGSIDGECERPAHMRAQSVVDTIVRLLAAREKEA